MTTAPVQQHTDSTVPSAAGQERAAALVDLYGRRFHRIPATTGCPRSS
jgi:hypothetical protein